MKHYRIAAFPGDGIGVEVVGAALRVLDAVQEQMDGFVLETTQFGWGATHWVETGSLVPPDFLDILRGFDAILFGAIGDPARVPDHITLEPLIKIRQGFD